MIPALEAFVPRFEEEMQVIEDDDDNYEQTLETEEEEEGEEGEDTIQEIVMLN